jgi:hypothetical protein
LYYFISKPIGVTYPSFVLVCILWTSWYILWSLIPSTILFHTCKALCMDNFLSLRKRKPLSISATYKVATKPIPRAYPPFVLVYIIRARRYILGYLQLSWYCFIFFNFNERTIFLASGKGSQTII